MPRRKASSSGNTPATASSSSRSRRRRKPSVLPYLPKEIMPEILIWLSGNFLRSTVSRVCDAWSKIITHPGFVDRHPRHLLNSTSGLIIQEDEKPYGVRYFQIDQNSGKVRVTDLFLQLPGRATARCEGALLVHWRENYQHRLIVADCMDMRVHDVPPPPVAEELAYDMLPPPDTHLDHFRIARNPGTGELKVICQYRLKEYGRPCYYYLMETTLTGTNDYSWRMLDFDLTDKITSSSSMGDGISIGGVVYAFSENLCSVYAIDLCTESAIYKIQSCSLHPADNKHTVCATAAWEAKLCCFFNLENRILAFQLDLDKRGWFEVDHFGNLIRRKIRQDNAEPIVCLDSDGGKMVLAKSCDRKLFKSSYSLVAYNMRTGGRKKIEGVLLSPSSVILPHSP